jgi:hypothetical protein
MRKDSHIIKLEELPPLKQGTISLMKEAIVNYFVERELIQ